MIVILMGVSGSGKTTIGSLLAAELGWRFLDGDDYHSEENRDKMTRGIPLTDLDRVDWLLTLRNALIQQSIMKRSVVLACSALRDAYRKSLKIDRALVQFVYLKGPIELIRTRITQRKGHYMKPQMLASQFEILEEPKDALIIDVHGTPGEIVDKIRAGIGI